VLAVEGTSLREITFALFSDSDLAVFEDALSSPGQAAPPTS